MLSKTNSKQWNSPPPLNLQHLVSYNKNIDFAISYNINIPCTSSKYNYLNSIGLNQKQELDIRFVIGSILDYTHDILLYAIWSMQTMF